MSVRIAIRPRLVLPEDPAPKHRRRFRLPKVALPALAYWCAMGAVTYAFSTLGESAPGEALVDEAALSENAAWPNEPPPEPAATPPEPAATPPEPAATPPEPTATLAARTPLLDVPEPDPVRWDEPPAPARARPRDASPLFDALEEPTSTPAAPRAPTSEASTPPSPTPRPAAGDVGSCEAAQARVREQLTIGAPRGPIDVTRDTYSALLDDGRYLSPCAVPDRTVIEVCTAIHHGRAVGVTVVSEPRDPRLTACVKRAVLGLRFPESSRLDVTRTRFDAVGR